MGTEGISYVRTAYYVSTADIKLNIVWDNANSKIEGEYNNKYPAVGTAESILAAREGGWLMGYYR